MGLFLSTQAYIPTAYAEDLMGGNGIRTGYGRLHPYIQLDAHYLENPGRLPNSGPNDISLIARPGLEYRLPGKDIDIGFEGDFEYQKYLGIQDKKTSKLSNFAGRANLKLKFLRDKPFNFNLHNKFLRSEDPANQTVTRRLKRVYNNSGIGFHYQPGGGALVFKPQYSFWFERYDRDKKSGVSSPELLDNMRHLPKLRCLWKFLPKTALFLEVEGHIINYHNSDKNKNSQILMAQTGASGSVTQKIAVLLKAGYGNTFLDGNDNFQSIVGQAEFNYMITDAIQTRTGYVRTVQPTSLYNYFELHRAYVAYDQVFRGRIHGSMKVEYNLYRFGKGIPGETKRRNDNNVILNFSVGYQIKPWLVFSVLDRLDWRSSEYKSSGIPVGYFYNDVYLRLGYRY